MRTIVTATALGLALAVAACSQTEQDKTQAEANQAASTVKENSIEVGNEMEANLDKAGAELKDITSDPDVKKAADQAKEALKGLGSSIKDASKDDQPAAGATAETK